MLTSFFTARKKKEEGILNFLEDVKSRLVQVDLKYHEPNKIDWESIKNKLSYDAYMEVAPGVYDRLIKDASDIKFDTEKKYKDLLRKMDFKNNIVIFCVFEKGGSFPPHFHSKKGVIRCLEGSYIGNEDEVYIQGEVQTVPPKQVHIFKPLSDGVCLITIEK